MLLFMLLGLALFLGGVVYFLISYQHIQTYKKEEWLLHLKNSKYVMAGGVILFLLGMIIKFIM